MHIMITSIWFTSTCTPSLLQYTSGSIVCVAKKINKSGCCWYQDWRACHRKLDSSLLTLSLVRVNWYYSQSEVISTAIVAESAQVNLGQWAPNTQRSSSYQPRLPLRWHGNNEWKSKEVLWRAENRKSGDLRLLRHIPTAADDCWSTPEVVDVRGSLCATCE